MTGYVELHCGEVWVGGWVYGGVTITPSASSAAQMLRWAAARDGFSDSLTRI